MIDTHAHFDPFPTEQEQRDVMDRAAAVGVSHVIVIGCSREGNRTALAAAQRFPGQVFAAIGYDREQAQASVAPTDLTPDLNKFCVKAIGEIGLDYHYHPETAPEQCALLRAQLVLAAELDLPVVIHTREAEADTIEILAEHAKTWPHDPGRIGVIHCFSGSRDLAAKTLDLGFHLSFSGIVTFRKAAELRVIAAWAPQDRMLAETDTPYLAPVPHRGKRNEPAYVRHVVEKLAEVRNCEAATIAAATTANARYLFQI